MTDPPLLQTPAPTLTPTPGSNPKHLKVVENLLLKTRKFRENLHFFKFFYLTLLISRFSTNQSRRFLMIIITAAKKTAPTPTPTPTPTPGTNPADKKGADDSGSSLGGGAVAVSKLAHSAAG